MTVRKISDGREIIKKNRLRSIQILDYDETNNHSLIGIVFEKKVSFISIRLVSSSKVLNLLTIDTIIYI